MYGGRANPTRLGLRGATQLLERKPRPVIPAEAEDRRMQAWCYRTPDLVNFLEERGYRWFGLSKGGDLVDIVAAREKFEANLVAVPNELIKTGSTNLGLKQ
jgi:hypothetical protein